MNTNIIPQQVKNWKHYFVARFYCIKYKNPSKKLNIIGVTGSDGKTTTANIIYNILKSSGFKVGVISTLSVKTQKKEFPLDFHVTNPAPKDLQKILSLMVEEGLDYVILETTSHGLDQHRIAGVKYKFAVYTNVSHEHLDYHKTYENYLKTKAKLIHYTTKDGIVIINKDDFSSKHLLDLARDLNRKIITYGFDKGCDLKADEFITEKVGKLHFTITYKKKKHPLKTNLKGRYNIYNIMASIAVARELKIPFKKISDALSKMPTLEGRWEVIKEKPFQIILDFAHTPNALENVLKRGDEIRKKGNNLIVVFGCAGKRDHFKRPKMGEASAKYADKIILTAEDPRGEDVEKINREIIEGIKKVQPEKKNYLSIPDRTKAIEKSLEMARKGDIVIITGKGHEKSMNLDGKEELPWNEREIILQALKNVK